MPKILKPAEEKIMRAVRDSIVIDPLISLRSLQDVLEKKGIKISNLHYLSKLIWKINKDLSTQVDRTEITSRIAQLKERQRIVADRLVRIAFYTDDLKRDGLPPPSYRDQIMAMNAIIKLDLAILGAEMDMGIFERHIGTVGIEARSRPLLPEQKQRMFEALVNWGIIPKENETTKNINNGDKANTTTTAIVVAKQ